VNVNVMKDTRVRTAKSRHLAGLDKTMENVLTARLLELFFSRIVIVIVYQAIQVFTVKLLIFAQWVQTKSHVKMVELS